MAKEETVFFITPPSQEKLYRGVYCTYVSKANYIWQPQDFVLISAQVPEKYEAVLLDGNIDNLSENEIFRRMDKSVPVLAVVSVSTIVLENDLSFLNNMRGFFPDLKILVFGDILLEKRHWGKVLSLGVDILLDPMDIDLVRYINTGKTESRNIRLCKNQGQTDFERKKGEKPKEVSIGVPRHKIFVNPKYRNPFIKSFVYTTVTTQFSCPFSCAYCVCSNIPVTYRKYDEILSELDYVKQLKIKDIFFGDPSFGFPKENALKIVEGMIEREYGFNWCCYFNPNLSEKEVLKKMRLSGCHTVIIGVEDENAELLKDRYKRDLSREKLFNFVRECRVLGIKICGDFIVGLNNSPEAFDRMVDLAIELDLDYASFNILVPLMGSIFREELIARGEITQDQLGYDTSGTTGKENAEFFANRNRAIRRFYFRPRYLFSRLRSLTSIPEFVIHAQEMAGLIKNTFMMKRG